MKIRDLFEAEQMYDIERTVGLNEPVKHDGISLRRISDMTQFSHAEKQRIARLEVGDDVTLKSNTEYGRAVVCITRKS